MAFDRIIPFAMLFVRCRGGVSHNPAEFASPADIDIAARVLSTFIDRIGIMTRLRIAAGPYQFEARLEVEAAPKTCAKFLTLLPYRQQIIHVRWSGEGCWIPLGEFDFGLGYDASPSAAGPVVAAVDRLVQCQKR